MSHPVIRWNNKSGYDRNGDKPREMLAHPDPGQWPGLGYRDGEKSSLRSDPGRDGILPDAPINNVDKQGSNYLIQSKKGRRRTQ
jgi:hypothetical protein